MLKNQDSIPSRHTAVKKSPCEDVILITSTPPALIEGTPAERKRNQLVMRISPQLAARTSALSSEQC
jgi:hypothetical protein